MPQQGSWIDGYWYPTHWMGAEQVKKWKRVNDLSIALKKGGTIHRRLGMVAIPFKESGGSIGDWHWKIITEANTLIARSRKEGYATKCGALKSLNTLRDGILGMNVNNRDERRKQA